jgi:hypothetical protein
MQTRVLKPFLFVIGLVLIVSLACGSTPTATSQPQQPSTSPSTSSVITDAVMAADVQGDTYDPVGITDTFPADQGIFHCVVTISDAPADTNFKVVWLSDSGSQMGEYELAASSSRNLDFTFEPNGGALPAGSYRVEISVNGTLDRTVTFSVAQSPEESPTEPSATEAPASQPYFTEEFDGGLSNWSYFLTNGDENKMDLSTSDGSLVFDLQGKNLWVYVLYEPYTYSDVRIDARVDNRGSNNNNISLICRYDENEGWYEFNVANSGLYQILYGKWNNDKNKASYATVADGGSNSIHQGKDVNEYTAICKDRTLSLFINGTETKTVQDNQWALREGFAGISASSFNDLPVKVEYEWVRLSEP